MGPETNIVDPRTGKTPEALQWRNADSLNGRVKGTPTNCVLVALADAGALDTKFWLEFQSDAPGMSVAEFAKKHPRGSFLVDFHIPDSPPEILPLYWKGNDHYSALVNGVLHNATASCVDHKINYCVEVLHEQDLKERGIDPNAPAVKIQDGTALEKL
jgi:hypothetical protein